MSVPSASCGDAALVAQLRAAGCVFAEDEARLLRSAAATAGELHAMLARRVAGEPIEHVVGWAEFHDLAIHVDRGVFVPRRRSEFLVQQAAEVTRPGTVVLDLCCGSGALGAALAAQIPVELYASDIEEAAVACARRNLTAFHGRVFQGDLFQPLPSSLRGRVDVLLANVPYVPSTRIGLMPAEAREHEARCALDGGADGLDVLRRVAAEAPAWLVPGGHLLVETSEDQAPAAVEAFARGRLVAWAARSANYEATVVIGRR